MSPYLVRMSTSFIVPLASFDRPASNWVHGPFPNYWRTGRRQVTGDVNGRRPYVRPGIDGLLYDERWHQLALGPCPALPELELKAFEVLALPVCEPQPTALLVVHGRIDVGCPDVFVALDRALNHNPSHGSAMRSWLETLVNPWAEVHSDHRRAEHVTLVTSSAASMPPLDGRSSANSSDHHNYWLARIASHGRYAPDPELIEHAGKLVGMSGRLRGLVGRSCIAVAGLLADSGRSDGTSGFDYGGAEFFAEGLYLDVLLLGQLQTYSILDLRRRIADARRLGSSTRHLDALELAVVDFRRKYWRTDFAPQGSQDDFLAAYQEANSLPQLLGEVSSQLAEYSGHVQRHEQQLTNAAIGLVGLLGFPLSLAVGIWAGLDDRTGRQLQLALLCAIGVFLFLTAALPGVRRLARDLIRRGKI